MIPILAGVVLLRKLGLIVFYSRSSYPPTELFPVQAIGDFFFALAWAFGLVVLPLGRVRPWLWLNVSSTIVVIPLSWVLLGTIGLQGVVVAYAFSQLIQAGLSWWYIARYTSFHLAARNTWLLVRSLALLVAPGVVAAGRYRPIRHRRPPVRGLAGHGSEPSRSCRRCMKRCWAGWAPGGRVARGRNR